MTVDLGTRRLRCFIAVAEELSFTRAAGRLFVAQQALSQQVRHLEDALQVRLFERTTRQIRLTKAGEVFLVDARRLVAEADAMVVRARLMAAGKSATLRLGFSLGGIRPATRAALAAFEAEHAHVEIQLQEAPWDDPSAGLITGATDVAVVHVPHGVPGLDCVSIDTTMPCAALPLDHPLAERGSLTVGQLSDLPSVAYEVPSGSCLDRWNIGVPAVRARTLHEWMAGVVTGRGFGIIGSAARISLAAPGVVYLPVTGLPNLSYGFAARAGDPNPLVRTLLALTRATSLPAPPS